MPRERTFWLLLASLLTAGFVTGPWLSKPHQTALSRAADTPEPMPQPRTERAWQQGAIGEPELTVRYEDAGLYRPAVLTTDRAGNLFVIDYDDLLVKELSPAGEPVRSFGTAATESSPPLLGSPGDLAVDRQGQVWVSDLKAPRVTVFDSAGDVTRTIELDHVASRIVPDGSGGFLGLTPGAGDHVFTVFSPEGEPQTRFGQLLEPAQQNALTLDGWLAADGDGGAVYALLHTGWLAAYRGNGELRFLRQTIEPLPLPTVQVDAADAMQIDRQAPLASRSVGVAGEAIYTLTTFERDGVRQGAIDVYALADGAYRYSLPLPSPARYLHVTDCCFYTLDRDTLRRWRRDA